MNLEKLKKRIPSMNLEEKIRAFLKLKKYEKRLRQRSESDQNIGIAVADALQEIVPKIRTLLGLDEAKGAGSRTGNRNSR